MALSYAFAGLLVLAGMTSVVTASTSMSCTNVTLNNILNIGTCLGSNLNYCSGGTSANGLVTGLVKLLNCVLQGIYTNGSPQGTVSALGPLLSLIVSRLMLTSVNLPVVSNTTNFFIRNDTCQGPITIQLPGPSKHHSGYAAGANLDLPPEPDPSRPVQAGHHGHRLSTDYDTELACQQHFTGHRPADSPGITQRRSPPHRADL
ncbi:hypothetical protein MTO96_035287 [Rhipicephalus appendiculatus]